MRSGFHRSDRVAPLWWGARVSFCLPVFGVVALARGEDRAGLDFFESKIRPVLAESCYECHSGEAEKIKGELVLDSKVGWETGGESGPAVVPGDPEKSPLFQAITAHPDVREMPPKERLADEVADDFRKWIEMGAPDPRTEKALPAELAGNLGIDIEEGRKFWSFQPVVKPAVPAVKNAAWPRNEIDHFILARLEGEGMEPGGDAPPGVLHRRLHFDLTGLPPEGGESGRDAGSLIGELIDSPHFGEHWGRHWLDLARYADSNGGDINLTFHDAWRFRNYVIDAFNADKPFDAFIREQIAGDLWGDDPEKWVATGFLIVGSKMLSERNKEKMHLDIADEQIDTVGRVFLGLSLGCARCHDHKFDPIPTRDYYGLAGIFRSTVTSEGVRMGNVNVSGWSERELPVSGPLAVEIEAHRGKVTALENGLKALKAELVALEKGAEGDGGSELGIVVDDADAVLVGEWKVSTHLPRFVGKGYIHDDKSGKGEKSATFVPDLPEAGEYEVRISYAHSEGRDAKVPVMVRHAGGEKNVAVNQSTAPGSGGIWDVLGRFRFEKGKVGSVVISNGGTTGHVLADAVQFIPVSELEGGKEGGEGAGQARLAVLRPEIKEREKELKELAAKRPKAPVAMAARDRKPDEIGDIAVRIRGEAGNRGAVAPRGFIQVAMAPGEVAPAFPEAESGRGELAEWIASAENPLTARVTVNRIWKHLFGEGLVRTVDDFGSRGDRPSHPELLDWLAADFVEGGWSVKRTVRLIASSRTYQLQSATPQGAEDPENRLLAHQNRRRLPAESIRDALLFSSGQLDSTPADSAVGNLGEQAIPNDAKQGQSVQDEGHRKRSVYLPLVRNDMPAFLETFDVANPDVSTGQRNVTTVPAQALLMMNSEFVREMAAAVSKLAEEQGGGEPAGEIGFLYQRILQRAPSAAEVARAEAYLAAEELASFAQVLFASTEFRYLD